VYASLREAGIRRCERAGYDVETRGEGAVATPGTGAVGLVDRPRELTVEPLGENDVTPGVVVHRLARALRDGRDCLFVVPAPGGGDALARVVASVLAAPTALAADDPEGRRFYSGADRVPLSDGTYACVRAPADRLQWREVAVGADRPRLELSVADEVAAVLESVDALSGPDRAAFRHAYARGEDGRFRVFERGEAVDTFGGVRAMRRAGYTPVAAPLVPEHLFPADTTPGRSWGVCTPADDRVYGPDGSRAWP